MVGIDVKPLEEDAIQGKTMSLHCHCKVSLNQLIATEVGIGSNELLKVPIGLPDRNAGFWQINTLRLKKMYSINWSWTPKGSQVKYDVEQFKNKLVPVCGDMNF